MPPWNVVVIIISLLVLIGIAGFEVRRYLRNRKLLLPCKLCGGLSFHKIDCPVLIAHNLAMKGEFERYPDIRYRGPPIDNPRAEKMLARYRERYPDIPIAFAGGTPLRQRPPNVGGIGHPPYEGPNYTTDEEVAEEMQGLWHFGQDDDRFSDLSWEFESGRVAPDGTIWLDRDIRCASGTVTVPDIEVPKAARFGWQLVPDSRQHGYCEVRRVTP